MRAYVITTGAVFGLLAVAHVLRMIGEDARLATDPVYVAITAASAALSAWAWYVLRRPSGKNGPYCQRDPIFNLDTSASVSSIL